MLKIAVVEDQQEVRDELCRFIRQYAAENSLQVEVLPIEDGAVIAEHYEPGYDIIFMDVEMPGLDGFGAAEKIRAVDADAVLVFVTNMAQYAIKGYEVDALDYVLKPVSYGAFCTKLSRAIQRVQRRKGGQVALQLSGGGMQLLDTGDILYLETRNRMLYYHTSSGVYSVRSSLQSAEQELGKRDKDDERRRDPPGKPQTAAEGIQRQRQKGQKIQQRIDGDLCNSVDRRHQRSPSFLRRSKRKEE